MKLTLHFPLFICWLISQASRRVFGVDPYFSRDIDNVTVTLGKDAVLSCNVENLNGFKVAWVRVDTQTILTIHRHVITRNYRISLEHKERRQWDLHISNVSGTDRGWYMCQINTDPMKWRRGYLEVVVPPNIKDSSSSKDMVVREGDNVTLVCRASGYPRPVISWRKEDDSPIHVTELNLKMIEGETINFTKISRIHMGAYLCIASNGVPPAVSKRILLRVQFSPMMMISNMLEGAYYGQNITIECKTEAYPESINFWTNETGGMINAGDNYEVVRKVEGLYKVHMSLTIKQLTKTDFTTYKCIAKNSLGSTEGSIKIYEIPYPHTATTTTSKPKQNKDLTRQNTRSNDANRMRNEATDEWENQIQLPASSRNSRRSSTTSTHSTSPDLIIFCCFLRLLFKITL